MLLVGCQEGHLARKKSWWGACMVIFWSEVQIACIWFSWCHRHPIMSASAKSQIVYLSCTGEVVVVVVYIWLIHSSVYSWMRGRGILTIFLQWAAKWLVEFGKIFRGKLWLLMISVVLSLYLCVYQAFNTFIDDVFAFIITMPTAHRLACFRDDVVFFIYLYQRWYESVVIHVLCCYDVLAFVLCLAWWCGSWTSGRLSRSLNKWPRRWQPSCRL